MRSETLNRELKSLSVEQTAAALAGPQSDQLLRLQSPLRQHSLDMPGTISKILLWRLSLPGLRTIPFVSDRDSPRTLPEYTGSMVWIILFPTGDTTPLV